MNTASLKDQIVSVLRTRLCTGELKQGEIYTATSIAAEFGVSNTPVREAFLELTAHGVVEPVRNQGFRVTPVTESDHRDLQELRMLVEFPAMMQLIDVNISDEEAAQLHGYIDRMVQAAEVDDLVSYLTWDRTFHLELLGLLRNSHIAPFVDMIRTRKKAEGMLSLLELNLLESTANEHRKILQAVIDKDRQRLEGILRDHFRIFAPVETDPQAQRSATSADSVSL